MKAFVVTALLILHLYQLAAVCVCGRCSCTTSACSERRTGCLVPEEGLEGIMEVTDGELVYAFNTGDLLGQDEALAACKKDGFDHLLTITSEKQRRFIDAVLRDEWYELDFWTSMRIQGGKWTWLPNNSAYTEKRWWYKGRLEQQDRECASMASDSALIFPAPCVRRQYWICQAKLCR